MAEEKKYETPLSLKIATGCKAASCVLSATAIGGPVAGVLMLVALGTGYKVLDNMVNKKE